MDFMKKLELWTYASTREAVSKTGRQPIGTRWVDADKRGGEELNNRDLRSILVVQETRRMNEMDAGGVFSATPPLEGLRVLASMCMTGDADDVIHVLDISRAHQHCDLTREVYIKWSKEDLRSEEDDSCGLLQKALNGVRDAARAFEQRIKRPCLEAGARQGAFNPCTYYNPEWKT
eukprot:710354-Amphidinium_carterae.1